MVFWIRYQYSGGPCCLHLQDENIGDHKCGLQWKGSNNMQVSYNEDKRGNYVQYISNSQTSWKPMAQLGSIKSVYTKPIDKYEYVKICPMNFLFRMV